MKFDKLHQLLTDKNMEAVIILSPHNRRYLSLFTGSSGALVMTKEENLLITDFRYISQATEQTDFTIIKQTGGLLDTIKTVLQDRNIKSAGFEGDLVTFQQYQTLSQQTELIDIAGEVEKIRMVKEPFEIEIIQQAADIADQAYEHIQTFIQAGKTELEVSNELEMFMRQKGASGSSFDTIVASGVRGALPHGVASNKVIEQGDMITLDYGAIYNGYISDITRTLAVGEPLQQMRQIYDIVLKAQMTALETIKPGITGSEADGIARQIIADAGYGEAFGHSLGHGIGLEVHEGPGLSMTSDVQLEPNMCVTLEPGIYIEGLGGVRIEDDVLVTESGLKRFTHSSKELIIL